MDKDPYVRKSSRSKALRSSTPYARPTATSESTLDSSSTTSTSSSTTRRKSFFGKVTDSVKELLTPSWLSSFVAASSPLKWPSDGENKLPVAATYGETSTAGGGAVDEEQRYDAHASSTFLQQQHAARSQTASTSQMVHSQYVRGEESTVPIVPIAQSTSAGGAVAPHQSSYFSSPAVGQPSRSEQELANGCREEIRDDSLARRSSSRAARLSSFIEDSRRPVTEQADEDVMNESAFTMNRSASFNISSFAKSFSESMDNSILNTSLRNSSFYSGRTVYGGMSSKRSLRLPNAVPYKRVTRASTKAKAAENGAVEKQQNVAPAATSKAAKLILKALEETGIEKPGAEKKSAIFSPAIYLRRKENMGSRPIVSTPPLHRLPKNTQAKITPNMFKREVKQPPAQYGSTSYSSVQVERFSSPGGKLRRDRGQHHYSMSRSMEEPVEVPDLPTRYTLQLSATPDISFVHVASNGVPVPAIDEDKSGYNFSSPQPLSKELAERRSSISEPFTFASPSSVNICESVSEHDTVSQIFPNSFPAAKIVAQAGESSTLNASLQAQPFGWTDLIKQDMWSCDSCLIKNGNDKEVCLACGTKKAVPPITATPTSGWGNLIKESEGKWSCSVCLVQNNKDNFKCVVCGSASISKKPAEAAPSTSAADGWGGMFTQSADKWSCESCLLQNDQDKTDCVACGSKKSLTKPASSQAPAPPTGSGWGDLFKNVADNWGCEACLLKNESGAAVCVACGTNKPSSDIVKTVDVTVAEPVQLATSSGWGDVFKVSNTKWGCKDCLLQNEKEAPSCVACGAKNPSSSITPASAAGQINSSTSGWGNLFPQSSDTWTCDSCLIKNDKDQVSCLACGTKNPSGGAQKPVTTCDSGQSSTTTGSGWGNLFAKPSGQWSCDACLISNPGDRDSCLACATKKPSSGPSAATPQTSSDITGTATAGWSNNSFSAAAVTGTGWGSLFAQQTTWKCSTCYIANEPITSLCVACGACRPGTQSSLGDLDRGKQIPLYEEKVTAPAPAPTTPSNTPSSGFGALSSLQHPAASVAATPHAAGGFGAMSSMKHPSAGQDTICTVKPATGGFGIISAFKHPALSEELPSPQTSVEQTIGFGNIPLMKHPATSTPCTKDSSEPAKFAAVTQALDAVGTEALLFSFGQKTVTNKSLQDPRLHGGNATLTPSVSAFAATLPFSFGKSTATTEPSKSSFSTSSQPVGNSTTSSTATPIFSFGKSAKPEDSPAFSSQSTAMPAVPLFSFGKSSTDKTTISQPAGSAAGAPTFSFGQQPKEAANAPFQFGSTQPAPPSTQSNPTGQFGSTQVTAGTSQASSIFTFGSSQPSSDSQIKPSSLFGASQQPSGVASTSQPSFPMSGFQFNSSTSAFATTAGDSHAKKRSLNNADDPAAKKPAGNMFGSSSSIFANTASKPGFQFGAPTANQNQPAAASPFQFGNASQTSEKKNLFQFGTTPIASPSGSFLLNMSGNSKPGDSSTSGPPHHGNGNNNNSTGGRVIKKAIRRIPKS